MKNTLLTALGEFGFSKNAARAVAALFELRQATATVIAQSANIPRTTVYGALAELVGRKVVSKVKIRGKYQWEIIAPEELGRRLRESNVGFQGLIPALSEIYRTSSPSRENDIPRVSIYQGKNEVFQSYSPLLSLKKGERIYAIEGQTSIEEKAIKYSSRETINWQEIIKKRGVVIESLTNEEAVKQFLRLPKEVLAAHYGRPVILWVLPSHFLQPAADIILYRNYLLQIDQARDTAILIKSTALTDTYRQLFSFAKQSAKKADLNQLIKERLGL